VMHDSIIDQLISHEGERLKPYRCTAGKLTIGVGRNIEDVGISQDESRYMLANDIRACEIDLQRIFPGFLGFTQGRQWALIDMRFNLGPYRFRKFKCMIAAINDGDWLGAGNEARNSRWASQVQKIRVETIVRQLKEGF